MKRSILIALAALLTLTPVYAGGPKKGYKKGIHDFSFPDGSFYSGEWVKFQPHGTGKMVYPDGSVYTGLFSFGQPSGKGVMKYANGDAYDGEWAVGKRSGDGDLTLKDGTVLHGGWIAGEINGSGNVKYPDGRIYEGIMTGSKVTGSGKMITARGTMTGQFEDGRPIGKYTLKTSSGSIYTCWEEDAHTFESGIWWINDTLSCKGVYRDGKPYGNQQYKGTNGTSINGIYKDGTFTGTGKLVLYDNKGKYVDEGSFVDSKIEGQGTRTREGLVYKGAFKEGKWHGEGILTDSGGGYCKGIFEEGKIKEGDFKDFDALTNESILDDLFDEDTSGKKEKVSGDGVELENEGDSLSGAWMTFKFKNGDFDGPVSFVVEGMEEGHKVKVVYDGEFNKDLGPNGKVVYVLYRDGVEFKRSDGTWADGRFVEGTSILAGSGTATGKWDDDFFLEGTCKDYPWDDPEGTYTGSVVGGKMNGTGKFVYGDGAVYEGGFKNDNRHGNGSYTSANGAKFIGQWVDDGLTGQGTYTSPDGAKYTGQWKEGKQEGQGTFVFSNGSKYVGLWKDGAYHGQGTFTTSKGVTYSGKWEKGAIKQGTVVYPSVGKYVGALEEGVPSGQGTMIYENGDKYVGAWEDGSPNGQGTKTYGAKSRPFIKATGYFVDGVIRRGTLVKTSGTYVGEWDEDGYYLGNY